MRKPSSTLYTHNFFSLSFPFLSRCATLLLMAIRIVFEFVVSFSLLFESTMNISLFSTAAPTQNSVCTHDIWGIYFICARLSSHIDQWRERKRTDRKAQSFVSGSGPRKQRARILRIRAVQPSKQQFLRTHTPAAGETLAGERAQRTHTPNINCNIFIRFVVLFSTQIYIIKQFRFVIKALKVNE